MFLSDVFQMSFRFLSGLEVPFKLMETKSPKLAVRENELSFESLAWTNTSEVAKDLLQGMLMKDSSSRLTTTEALAHEWFRREPRLGTISEGPF